MHNNFSEFTKKQTISKPFSCSLLISLIISQLVEKDYAQFQKNENKVSLLRAATAKLPEITKMNSSEAELKATQMLEESFPYVRTNWSRFQQKSVT